MNNFIKEKSAVTPKKENQNKGFYYTVTDEQIAEHRKRSIKDIFMWIESTQKLINQLQTPAERLRSKEAKNFQW